MIARHEAQTEKVDLWSRLAGSLPAGSVMWRQDGKAIERDGRYIARFVSPHRLLLVATSNDAALDREPAVADALAALRRETNCECIHLEGLSTHEGGKLVELVAGQDVPRTLATAITAETGGNPRPCSLSSHKPPFWTIRQTMTPASLGGFLMSIAWGKRP